MLLISNNLRKYMPIPDDAVIRVNMAWYSPEVLKENLKEIQHDVFMDVPIGRTKPPMNRYTIGEVADICGEYSNVKYLGVSNVKSPLDMSDFFKINCQVIPKIECIEGIKNSHATISALDYENKFVMLDHEDLHHDLLDKNVDPTLLYSEYVRNLKEVCEDLNCVVLQTAGIVFCELVTDV